MSLTFKKGNVFDTSLPAIGHGVNIVGLMGAGIAVEVRNRYPDVYEKYFEICAKSELEPGEALIIQSATDNKFVANIASQDNPGRNARLEWLDEGVRAAVNELYSIGLAGIALPHIGAGIGGLKLSDVVETLEKISDDYPDFVIELWEYAQ